MHFLREFWMGISSYADALRFIRQHKLGWYALIPATLMLLIFHLGYRLMNRTPDFDFSNMNGIVWYCIQSLFEILLALTLMKFTKYIVVIVLSPLLSHLSQKCERIIGTPDVTTTWADFKSDIMRSLRLTVRNIFWEYAIFILLIIICLIGWDNPMKSPIYYISFIVGFYFYGFSFLDYHNERIRRSAADAVEFTRAHRGLAMGIGAVYSLLISIPIQLDYLFVTDPESFSTWQNWKNFLIHFALWVAASIAPILAIVAATLSSNQLERESEKILVEDNESVLG